MTEVATNIEERRFALMELNSIMKLMKAEYGDKLPMDVVVRLAELAKMYRAKYGAGFNGNPRG
jgi:uncharacterized protein YeeX (DUF496 family)